MIALIKPATLELVQMFGALPQRIDLPGNVQVHAPPAGWEGHGHKLVGVVDTMSPVDTATQVREGPSVVIETGRVTRTWTVRSKTAPELDADKELILDRIDRLNFLVNLDQENRLRVLEVKPSVTAAQYRAALKARL